MGAISPVHLLIVLIVALIVIGPRKLPETGAALGKALREFREATRDDPTPEAPAVPAQAAEPHDPTAASAGQSGTPPEA